MPSKRTYSELDDSLSQNSNNKRCRISINDLLNNAEDDDEKSTALLSVQRLRNGGTNNNRKEQFPFNFLPPEIRNMIYAFVIEDDFKDRDRDFRLINPPTAEAALFVRPLRRHGIPYGKYGNYAFKGVSPEHLPPFENFLKANKKLYIEFASTRIGRSELVLPPRFSHDGVLTTFDHQRLKIGDLDRMYAEQITYQIGRASWYDFRHQRLGDNQVFQSRIYGLGTSLRRLATDTKLPSVSRVCVQIEGCTLCSRYRGRNTNFAWARYDWTPMVDGLRNLMQSGKIRVFELRCDEQTRLSKRITELQGLVNKLLGISAKIEGEGCSICQPPADDCTNDNWQYSMVWHVPVGKALTVKDSKEDLKIWDCSYCHRCYKAPLHEYDGYFEEEEEFVYQGF